MYPFNIFLFSVVKHIRHAAFAGQRDNLTGSSANVLTGGSITFGTSGTTLLFDDKQTVAF
jgi:hypothetical protein